MRGWVMENKHKHNPNLNEFNKYKSMEDSIGKRFADHRPKENQIPRYMILSDKGLNLADYIAAIARNE
jgi:hypothetical protein